MKNILILVLGCNNDFFDKEYNVCQETWLSNTLKYPNIDYFIIRASRHNLIDYERHVIYVDTEDDVAHTFIKNKRAFELLINNNINFDYIVRTNTSVYVNIDALDKYCNDIIKDDAIQTCDIYRNDELCYPIGKCVILNKKHIYTIINSPSYFEESNDVDDFILGKILYNFGYTVFAAQYVYTPIDNHHLLDREVTYDKLKNILVISLKCADEYDKREKEFDYMRMVHQLIGTHVFNEEEINNMANRPIIIYDNNTHLQYTI